MSKIWLQRLNGAGAAAFTANGLLVAGAALQQIYAQLLPDGSQGVYMCWEDHRANGVDGIDIYERHVNGSGNFVGPELAVCTEAHQQRLPAMIADGAGGQIISWIDSRSLVSSSTIFAQRFDASGNPMWAVTGVQVMPFAESSARLVSDGAGGAYVAGGASTMRIYANGTPAWVDNYAAGFASVSDAPLDEGGFVRLSLTAAVADATVIPILPANFALPVAYEVWRKVPGSAAFARGIASLANHSLVHPAGALTSLNRPSRTWEVVGTAYAHGLPSYSITVPTHADSTAASTAEDQFVVMTVTTNRSVYCASSVGTGHSVDNFAPPPQSLLTGGRTGSISVQLTWQGSGAADLWHYSVYRGSAAGFALDIAHRIAVPVSTNYADGAFADGSYYQVTAIDRHGNESPAVQLAPASITGVAPSLAPRVSYAAIVGANPFTRYAVIEYGLAQAGRVDLAIYDLAGRKVASLIDGERPAGVQRVTWEGAGNSSSRLEPGVYLARFEAPGVRRTLRLVRAN